uniref:BZIP domain-containing protein n=1 Tax=Acrobeloides nanus TaxID=290746 RepID=A0A914DDJ6_9BILA
MSKRYLESYASLTKWCKTNYRFRLNIESKKKRKRGRPIKEKYKNVPVRELNELKRKDNKEAALKYRQRVREERNEVKKLKKENSMLIVENSKLREELEQLKKSIAHSSSMVFTI